MVNLDMPDAFRSVLGLGEPMRVYRWSKLSRAFSVIACAACVLLALGIGYYDLVVYPQKLPDVARTNALFFLGIGAAILLGALYWAYRIFTRWNERAVVYEDGFAHFGGKRVRTFKWSEIASITMQVVKTSYLGVIPAGTSRKYTIIDEAGHELRLDGTLSKVDELIDGVREASFPYIMARSKQALDSGQSLAFGPISISRDDGLQKGGKQYAWDELAQVSVESGDIRVKPKSGGLLGGFSVPVAKTPNVDVFLALVAEMAEEYL